MPGRRDAPILVAVDLSSDSEAALAWAVEAGRAFGAPLIVLHVVHDPSEAPGYYARASEGEFGRLEDAAAEMLGQFVARVAAKLGSPEGLAQVERRIVVGLPVTRIVEVAVETGARQIVLGARGRTALAEIWLGSTAERVARLAPLPVTLVKGDASPQGTA